MLRDLELAFINYFFFPNCPNPANASLKGCFSGLTGF